MNEEIYKECFGKLEAIVNVKTGKIEKFEYLIRHEKYTPIELLDNLGKRGELDKLFIHQLNDAVKLAKENDIKISINIDNNVLNSKLVLEELKKFQKGELKEIEFEILEDNVDLQHLKEFVKNIENLGVIMNVDDFGSKKQTFDRVKDIKEIAGQKLKTIKLDGSLVGKFMENDKEAIEMVNEIVKYAKENEIKLVSEFINSFERFEKMSNYTDFTQGFLFNPIYSNSSNFKQEFENLQSEINKQLDGKLKETKDTKEIKETQKVKKQ